MSVNYGSTEKEIFIMNGDKLTLFASSIWKWTYSLGASKPNDL